MSIYYFFNQKQMLGHSVATKKAKIHQTRAMLLGSLTCLCHLYN